MNNYRRKAWTFWLTRVGLGLLAVAVYIIGVALWPPFALFPPIAFALFMGYIWLVELVDEKAAELEERDLYDA